MAIDKMKLFESTKVRWPQSVRIAPTDEMPGFEAEPGLVAIYEAIEKSCTPTGEWTPSDEWKNLANWSFHQAFWTLAKEAATERVFHREDVTFEMFDDCMRSNLSDESWDQERGEYESSPSRFH